MATTFISYSGNEGFWIAESFMQLTFYYIYEEALKPQYIITNKFLFLKDMKLRIDGYTNSYMTLGWAGFIESTIDIQTMIEILVNVKTNLHSKGEYISVNELMNISTEDYTLKYMLDKKDFPTKELIRVIDALIQMLQGTWIFTNYNMDLNWRYNELS